MELTDVKTLLLGLTNRCNGACRTCWHSQTKKDFQSQDLDLILYNKIKESLFRSIENLQLVDGGETFLYPNLEEVIKDVGAYNLNLSIVSNFSSISDKHKELLRDINVGLVASIDGSYRDLQEFLRPNCTYETVIKNIKYFRSIGKKVIMQVTVSNYNFNDMISMIDLAKSLDVNVVRFHEVQYLENLNGEYKFKQPGANKEYIKKVYKYAQQKNIKTSLLFKFKSMGDAGTTYGVSDYNRDICAKICPNMVNTIYIQSDGKMLNCCSPKSQVVGDLYREDISDIISSDKFEYLRYNCTCDIMKGNKI